MYIKMIGKWLREYHDYREEIALFEMSYDTEKEQKAAARYINYGIPHKDCMRLQLTAHRKAENIEDLNERSFFVYSRFYLTVIDYKIDRILEKVFGLV